MHAAGTENERRNRWLSLISLISGVGLDRLVDERLPAPGSGRGHRPSEVVLPTLLMLLGGGCDLGDIEVIARDRALREAAGARGV